MFSFFWCLSFGLSVLYSSNEELRTSACDFWCTILSSKDEVNIYLILFLGSKLYWKSGKFFLIGILWVTIGLSAVTFDLVHLQPVLIDWFPSYSELKGALEIYGFQSKFSSNRESLLAGKLFLTLYQVLSCTIHIGQIIFREHDEFIYLCLL